MAKHFTKRHVVNGYAAMGGNLARPRISGAKSRDVKDAIAAEKRKAARMAAASKSGK